MEIANSVMVRQSSEEDAATLHQLLKQAYFTHLHVDWHYPVDWLGTPAFYVAEVGGVLAACLAVAADPPPAAWVRVAVVQEGDSGPGLLSQMLREMLPNLRESGVSEIGWIATEDWPESWLERLAFRPLTEIETFVKEDLEPPPGRSNPAVAIRPVRTADMPALARIEEAAFEPLWRHSAEALQLGRRNALSFDVAELDGRPVGFQYSARSQESGRAHLVRMTVDPAAQGNGVGTALLYRALETYRRHGLSGVTLNTQVDNLPSQRLYAKFGFRSTGFRVPVWVRPVL